VVRVCLVILPGCGVRAVVVDVTAGGSWLRTVAGSQMRRLHAPFGAPPRLAEAVMGKASSNDDLVLKCDRLHIALERCFWLHSFVFDAHLFQVD
jgi:hypothetical protein